MRVTPLKASGRGVAGLVRYYEGKARDAAGASRAVGYYLDPDEPPGRWWGSGCDEVGLAGQVVPGQLGNMFEAAHPESGRRLGRGYGEKSVRGFDATFSAPKSVSVLWAIGNPVTRAEVTAAHDAAVDATLGWLERHGSLTRRGKDGVDQVDANGLCVAVFRQHTSRALDPQLHSHAVIWSKVRDDTGAWLALDARFLMGQQYTMSWIYDAQLRAELTRRLGVDWNPVEAGQGQSDIAGMAPEVLNAFSQRSEQVATKLRDLIGRWRAENDGADPDARDLYVLERRAAYSSRPGKSHNLDAARLRAEWRARAKETGFDSRAVQIGAPRPQNRDTVDREAVAFEAIQRVSESMSTWLKADLAREVVAQLPPDAAASPNELLGLVDGIAADAEAMCSELHPPALSGTRVRRDGRPVSEHATTRLLSTSAVLEQERRLIDWAAHAVEPAPDVEPADRQDVVAEAIGGHGELVLVVGPAGAGKTTATRAGVARLEAQGRAVIGLAPSGKAADVLAHAAGCRSATLAKLLHAARQHEPLPPVGTTVILDEAGMASTDDLDHLVQLARNHRWRIVAVGDPEQLDAVGRGGMFAHWTDTLPAHHLDVVHRFTEPWQAEASLALRRGDPDAARTYVEHRRVQTVHSALVAEKIARLHENSHARGRTVAITTSSAATARAINEEIQRQRNRTRPRGTFVPLIDGTCAQVGDRIATRRNDPTLLTVTGVQVRNRHTWTVTAVHDDGTVVATDDTSDTVTLPPGYVADHVELGWAVTGYGNQGITADHAICVIESGTSRANVYVGLTRGRNKNIAMILDPTGTAEPEGALARAIARPPNATTAHAARDQLHRAQGVEPPTAAPEPVAELEPAVEEEVDEVERVRILFNEYAEAARHERPMGRGL